MQTTQEKIFYLANELNNKFDTSPDGAGIIFKYNSLQDIDDLDCHYMLKKLSIDFKVISILEETEEYARVCKLKGFKSFLFKKADELKKVHSQLSAKNEHSENENKPLIWLSFNNKRELLLNDVFLLTTTRNNSINHRLLDYLIKNPNKTVSRNELESISVLNVEKKENKDFFVFLDDVNIKGDLRKLLFGCDLSKHTLHLTNPIYKKSFDEKSIDSISLRQLFK